MTAPGEVTNRRILPGSCQAPRKVARRVLLPAALRALLARDLKALIRRVLGELEIPEADLTTELYTDMVVRQRAGTDPSRTRTNGFPP